jgi:hypothetical protein
MMGQLIVFYKVLAAIEQEKLFWHGVMKVWNWPTPVIRENNSRVF